MRVRVGDALSSWTKSKHNRAYHYIEGLVNLLIAKL